MRYYFILYLFGVIINILIHIFGQTLDMLMRNASRIVFLVSTKYFSWKMFITILKYKMFYFFLSEIFPTLTKVMKKYTTSTISNQFH